MDREAVPVIDEELEIDRAVVEKDQGVRVRKTVSEREEVVDEPLILDEVVIERVAINELVTGATLPTTRREGETLIVPVLEQVLVIEKRTMLKEEVRIERRRREVRKPRKVALRREHVSADRFDDSADGSGRTAGRD